MKKSDDNIKKIADSALLTVTSRISGPLLVAICGFILTSILGMKTDISTVMAKIDGINTRVSTL